MEKSSSGYLINKLINGFLNGYIVDREYTSNISEEDGRSPDINLIIDVWKLGVDYGRFYRFRRLN